MASKSNIVDARCSKCEYFCGQYPNAWKQVTGSYYLQSQYPADVTQTIRPKGIAKPASATHEELQGCLLQPLACEQCTEVLAFRCIETPESKSHYKDRDFFKLGKLVLYTPNIPGANISTPQPVEPIVEGPRPPQKSSEAELGTPQPKPLLPSRDSESNPSSPNLAAPKVIHRSLPDADKAAVRGTNDGSLDWQEAHENWARDSGRELSPRSFATRVITKGGGKNVKTPNHFQPQPSQQHRIPPARTPVQLAPAPSPQMGSRPPPPPLQQKPPQQSPAQQQHFQPQRIESAKTANSPNNNNASGGNKALIWITDPATGRGRWMDPNDSVAASIPRTSSPLAKTSFPPPSSASTPTQHTTSMQAQLDQQHRAIEELQKGFSEMQRSLWNMEGALASVNDAIRGKLANTTTSNQDEAIASARDEAMDLLSETVADVATKTGKIDGMVIQLETLKRKVSRIEQYSSNLPMTPDAQRHSSFGVSSSASFSQSTPRTAIPATGIATNGVKRSAPAEEFDGVVSKRPMTSSTARSVSEASAHTLIAPRSSGNTSAAAASHGFTPANARNTASNYPPQGGWSYQQPVAGFSNHRHAAAHAYRARGRPRKTHMMTDHHDHHSEQSDGYGNDSPGPVDADGYFYETDDIQDQDQDIERGRVVRRGRGGISGKPSTRTKPVRNADGLLIRPNGTIDRRSITSKQNLAKYQKMKEDETIQRITTSQTGSPGQIHNTPSKDMAPRNITQTDGAMGDRPMDHSKIMSRMFPHGVASDADRMNHAARLFSPASPEKAKRLPRAEMEKEDLVEQASQSQRSPEMGTGGNEIMNNTDSGNGTGHVADNASSSYVPSTQGFKSTDESTGRVENKKQPPHLMHLTDDSSYRPGSNASMGSKDSETESDAVARSPNTGTPMEEDERSHVPDSDASAMPSRRASTNGVVRAVDTIKSAGVVNDSQASYKPSMDVDSQSQV